LEKEGRADIGRGMMAVEKCLISTFIRFKERGEKRVLRVGLY